MARAQGNVIVRLGLNASLKKNTQDWWIAMLCGTHNHDLVKVRKTTRRGG